MAKLIVNVPDSMVIVDGVARKVDLVGMPIADIRAIHFASETGCRIEWELGCGDPMELTGNTALGYIEDFRRAWDAAEPEKAEPQIDPNAIHIAYIKAALLEAGQLEAVNQAVTAAGGLTSVLWEYATHIKESDPEVAMISAALPKLDSVAIFNRARELQIARNAS